MAGVCVIFINSLQDNRYLHGLPFFSVQSYFNTSLLSEVVIGFHVQNTWLKEQRIFKQNVFSAWFTRKLAVIKSRKRFYRP